MMVCIVLIWFLLTVLQESSNLYAIFIVCTEKKKNSKLVFLPTPPPFFLVKNQFVLNLLTLPKGKPALHTSETIAHDVIFHK